MQIRQVATCEKFNLDKGKSSGLFTNIVGKLDWKCIQFVYIKKNSK